MEPDREEDIDALLRRLEGDLERSRGTMREVGGSLQISPGMLAWRERVWRRSRAKREELRHDERTIGPVTVRILEDATTRSMYYAEEAPRLSPEERGYLEFIESTLTATLRGFPVDDAPEARSRHLQAAIDEVIDAFRIRIDADARDRIGYYLERNFLGYGPIDTLMRDPHVEDISCDGPNIPIFIFHRQHGSMRTTIQFDEEKVLDGFIVRMAQSAGKHISVASPLLDATLPDRSRLQATLAREVTPRGSSFTIRRFRDTPVSPVELLSWGTLSPEICAFYWLLMEEGRSAIISGGTASGKTTSLNAWSLFIPRDRKIVSIEDTREINIPHENWIAGVARSSFGDKAGGAVDTFKLLEAALRQRPEYIIVGEVRGQEAFTLFQAMATGHATYATMHAESAYSAVRRLENAPINVPRVMIGTLDCLSVQFQVRVGGKRVRRVKEVVEFLGIDNESGELLTNTLFRWDPRTDTWMHGMKSYLVERIAEARGVTVDAMNQEWHRRALFLDAMLRRGITDHRDVAEVVAAYAAFPQETFAHVVEEMIPDIYENEPALPEGAA